MNHLVFVVEDSKHVSSEVLKEGLRLCHGRRSPAQQAADRVSLVSFSMDSKLMVFNRTWDTLFTAIDHRTENAQGFCSLTKAWQTVSKDLIPKVHSPDGKSVRTFLMCFTSGSSNDKQEEIQRAASECYAHATLSKGSVQNSCIGMVVQTSHTPGEQTCPIDVGGMLRAMNGGRDTIADTDGHMTQLDIQMAQQSEMIRLFDAICNMSEQTFQKQHLKGKFEEMDEWKQMWEDKEEEEFTRKEMFLKKASGVYKMAAKAEEKADDMEQEEEEKALRERIQYTETWRCHINDSLQSVVQEITQLVNNIERVGKVHLELDGQIEGLTNDIDRAQSKLTELEQDHEERKEDFHKQARDKKQKLDEKFFVFDLEDVNKKLEGVLKHQQRGKALMRAFLSSVTMTLNLMENSLSQLKQSSSNKPISPDVAPLRILDHYYSTEGLLANTGDDDATGPRKHKRTTKGVSFSHATWKALVAHICPERSPEEIEEFADNMSLDDFIPLESTPADEDAAPAVSFRARIIERLTVSSKHLDDERAELEDAELLGAQSRAEVNRLKAEIKAKEGSIVEARKDPENHDYLEELTAALADLNTESKQAREAQNKAKGDEAAAKRKLLQRINKEHSGVIAMVDRVSKDIRWSHIKIRLGSGADRFRAALTGTTQFFAGPITAYVQDAETVQATYASKSRLALKN
jgi:hypothetical protein